MHYYEVTHNGMEVKQFESPEQVNDFITGILKSHANLNPQKIFEQNKTKGLERGVLSVKVLIYQYYTIYKEMFYIEEKGR